MLTKYLWVFFVSMVPLIELRGAIPFSQGFGLPLIPSYIISIIGNMLPVPFIYFFADRFSKNRSIIRLAATNELISLFNTCCSVKFNIFSTAGLW